MRVTVTKLTDIELLRKANSFTTGKESHMSLAKAYALGHTTIRTQMFAIELHDSPLFVGSQLVRHHAGVEKWMRTRRTDRGAEDFREVCTDLAWTVAQSTDMGLSNNLHEAADAINKLPERFDRYAPTSLIMIANAEAIINMSRKRLCQTASKEAREIWTAVVVEIAKVDPDLTKHCVKPCVWRGYCSESKSCGFIRSDLYRRQRNDYKLLFV